MLDDKIFDILENNCQLFWHGLCNHEKLFKGHYDCCKENCLKLKQIVEKGKTDNEVFEIILQNCKHLSEEEVLCFDKKNKYIECNKNDCSLLNKIMEIIKK